MSQEMMDKTCRGFAEALAAREPVYRAAADDTVDADGTAEQAAGEIIDIYRGADAARNG